MCAKCHDLNNIISNASWTQHSLHVSQYGFSGLRLPHFAWHGLGNRLISGERLVNFVSVSSGKIRQRPFPTRERRTPAR